MAGIPPLVLTIAASLSPSVASAFGSVARSAGDTETALGRARERTEELERALAAAAASGDMSAVSAATVELSEHLESAAGQAEALADKSEKLRDFGAKLAGAGAAGLVMSQSLINIAEEGNAVEAKLEAVLSAQNRLNDLQSINEGIGEIAVRGHFDDDDALRNATVLMANWEVQTKDMIPLLEAAGRQAQTTGQDVEGMANAFGKAVATGNYQGLKKTAVSFSEVEIASIKAGYAISQQAGQMALVNSITAAVARTTGELGASLTDAQKAANDAARAGDDLATALGTGASAAKANVDNLLASVLSVAGANQEAAQTAGGLLYVGSAAATAGGTVLALAGQVGMVVAGMSAAGVTGTAAMAAITAAAGTALAAMTALATSMAGIAAAGIALGAVLYNNVVLPLQQQVDNMAPGSLKEAAGNAWATTKRAFGFDAEITEQDGLTASQRRAKMAAVARPAAPVLTPSPLAALRTTPGDAGMDDADMSAPAGLAPMAALRAPAMSSKGKAAQSTPPGFDAIRALANGLGGAIFGGGSGGAPDKRLTAKVQSMGRDGAGRIIVQFEPLVISGGNQAGPRRAQ